MRYAEEAGKSALIEILELIERVGWPVRPMGRASKVDPNSLGYRLISPLAEGTAFASTRGWSRRPSPASLTAGVSSSCPCPGHKSAIGAKTVRWVPTARHESRSKSSTVSAREKKQNGYDRSCMVRRTTTPQWASTLSTIAMCSLPTGTAGTLVVWGTGDVVQMALKEGIPVIWIPVLRPTEERSPLLVAHGDSGSRRSILAAQKGTSQR